MPTQYSICTLVTDRSVYHQMKESMLNKGFYRGCEYLVLDNTRGNRWDAFAGYNQLLQQACGTYVILCHQDLVFLDDRRERLDTLLAELTALDPHWGLCGNAGVTETGKLAIRITDPNTGDTSIGPFPARVVSLDENFIVVRREANLALSRDLSGFHWYGADLCLIADVLGWNAYVIDFHLLHKSGGNLDAEFTRLQTELQQKYSRAFRPRSINVTSNRPVMLSGISG